MRRQSTRVLTLLIVAAILALVAGGCAGGPRAAAPPAAPAGQAGSGPDVAGLAPAEALVAQFNDFHRKHGFLVVHDSQRWVTLLDGNEHVGWWAAPGQSQVAITVGLDPFVAAGLNPDLLPPDLWHPHAQASGGGPHAHHATTGIAYVRVEHLDVGPPEAVTEPGRALDTLLDQAPALAGRGPVSGAPALLLAGGDGVEWSGGQLTFFLNAEAIAAAGADVAQVEGWELVRPKGKPRLLVRRVKLPG